MIPTPDVLTRASEILAQIESLQAELAGLFSAAGAPTAKRRGRPPGSVKASAAANGAPMKRRRTMSAGARAKIAAAQRARWAKARAGQMKAAKA